MNYYEFTFTYTSDAAVEAEVVNDILAGELGEIGFESFVPTAEGLVAYIQEKEYDADILAEKLDVFPIPGIHFHVQTEKVIGKDWNEEWEKNYFKPIRIEKECIIRASFHEEEPGYIYTIIIDPKMAFGTGNHETTYLMISEMLKLDLTGKEVLDMGCGTAVLAILAALKGARRIVGIDIDEWAYNNALENIRLNKTEQIEVALGGAEQIGKHLPFDIIFANINRNILLNDIHRYTEHLKSEGLLFMSGFYEQDIPVIRSECEKNGLTFLSFEKRNDWVAVKVRKENKI